ncbi:hypothetical protein XH89_31415 [Bradyrhizobium sp. CCBAU 53340]|uniref:hypothetical protein n=1 Tax=Bradyrhizobium sp. CCBAU 53340 TaxID=1325112 RepID=UPI00188CB367|nr:hypothetical protein [Bradyrhizobium sp. CCBAU 53340]QOZ47496.1 hypothetical protein XH89_31415 [Bradyrhizobium sp. CCBAU 53340]
MANKPPSQEFGKRRPRLPADLPLPPREPVKRSGHVALLVMGTIAVGTTAFALMPRRTCEPTPPGATVSGATVAGTTAPAQASTNCSSSSSGGSGSRWSSRSGFYSSDSSSHSSSGGSSDGGSGGVTRGGFGSFAHAFSGGS